MKSDIHSILSQKGIDALVVYETNGTLTSPTMKYCTNGCNFAHPTVYLWTPTEGPFIIPGKMEMDKAKKTGARIIEPDPFEEVVAKQKGYRQHSLYLREILDNMGVSREGNIELHTKLDVSKSALVFNSLRAMGYHMVAGYDHDTISTARNTKGEAEMKLVKANEKVSSEVFEYVINILKTAKTDEEGDRIYLLNNGGKPLTAGEMKEDIRSQLVIRNMIDSEPTFFAIGKDASDPHNEGTDKNVVEFGKTILMDMFPQNISNGWWYDCTRTWFLGDPSERIQDAYDLVLEVQKRSIELCLAGRSSDVPHNYAADLFKENGFKEGWPRPKSGFRHGLGHGFGIEIHEEPGITDQPGKMGLIKRGSLFTIEPGLYMPKENWGIRIEDCIYINPNSGRPENLTHLAKEFVLRS